MTAPAPAPTAVPVCAATAADPVKDFAAQNGVRGATHCTSLVAWRLAHSVEIAGSSALTLLIRRLSMSDLEPANVADATEDGENDEEDLAAAYEALAEDRRHQETRAHCR